MIIWLILVVMFMPFAFVLIYGAPYLPTRRAQAKQALDMLSLKEGDVFVDLGSGDGTVLIEAARRGYECYGYELNPLVWLISKIRTFRFGSQINIYYRNFWKTQLPKKTQGVYVFLLDRYMTQLNEKLVRELPKGGQLVSYSFQIPGREPGARNGALFLYQY